MKDALSAFWIAFLVLAALILFARLERTISAFVTAVVGMVVAVLERIVLGLEQLSKALLDFIDRLRGVLIATDVPTDDEPARPRRSRRSRGTEPPPDTTPPRTGPPAGTPARSRTLDPNLVAPLLYALGAVMLLAGDIYLAVLRGGAMFGFDVPQSFSERTELQTLSSLLYIVCGIVFAALLFDAVRIGNLRSPFTTARPGARRVLAITALVGLLLSAALGGVQQLWGQRALEGFRDTKLSDAYSLGIIPLATIAAGLAVVGALHAPRVLLYVIAAVLNPPAGFLRWSAEAVGEFMKQTEAAVDRGLYLVGTPGATVWDWVCDFEFAERAHLQPIRDRRTTERVTVVADRPAFATEAVPEDALTP